MSDLHQESSCTLCTFKCDNETAFNQHILKAHRIVLKSARNSVDYKLKDITPREKRDKFRCIRCNKGFPISNRLRDHKIFCTNRFQDTVMARLKQGYLSCIYCADCFSSKAKLDEHLQTCSKPKEVCCQLCPFKCPATQMTSMQSHIWNEHNLVCEPVKAEADFSQSINCTPYTLKRVPVVDALPLMSEAQAKQLLRCWICQRQFSDAERLNNHSRNCSL